MTEGLAMDDGPETFDVVVVGGGPAGSFVAGSLAKRGRRVAVLEREEFPRFHIGESLLPQSLSVLKRAGALENVVAQGFVKKTGATFLTGDGNRSARFDFGDSDPPSEFPYAYQVERRLFDKVLLDWARDQGADVRTGATADAVEARGAYGLASVTTKSGSLRARFVVDAAGLDSVSARLRGWSAEPLVKDRAALFGHFRLEKSHLEGVSGAVTGDILIVTQDDVWWWLIPLAGGHTSVGFVVPIAQLAAMRETEPDTRYFSVAASTPALAERLAGAERLSPIRGARSYGRSNGRLYADGLVLAGDAAGFLDPVFSSGVCVALSTSEALADALDLALADPAAEPSALAAYEKHVRRAFASMGPFVETWYEGALKRVMFHEPKPPRIRASITSILAGELWNESNPIVRDGVRWVRTLDRMITPGAAPAG
jgi:flavin-dependent dehydrogenase